MIDKAVFPVAGMGTRFLPATKANPKEMLPIVDKPLIQYAAEEAVAAGIKQLIFVTSSSKRAIEDHFDKNFELEAELAKRNKGEFLKIVRNIVPPDVSCVYIRQPEALGLGHAVLCAESVVGNNPFAVILADDLIDGQGKGCLAQMIEQYALVHASILGIEQVPRLDVSSYGVIGFSQRHGDLIKIERIVEKPKVADAPSDQAVVGRYILSPAIFPLLRSATPGANQEIQLTDAIERLRAEEPVYGYAFKGKRYDCGNKLGYLKATVEYGLKHAELKHEFFKYLEGLKMPNGH